MKISLSLNIDYQYKTTNKSLLSYFSIILLYFLIHTSVYAQTIQGRLMDYETRTPISAANIYFSNYLLGTFSDDSGYFELSLPAQRPSQLVILHVNYENKYITISKSFIHPEKWIIELSPQVRNLEEVIISSKKDREWKKNLRSFTDAFFGKTENAKKCESLGGGYCRFRRLAAPGGRDYPRCRTTDSRGAVRRGVGCTGCGDPEKAG